MKHWPWLSLLLAIAHTVAGVSVLIVSSWFIAACAVASLNFNYMLPAVVIRALALLRIASGYGQMWLGHQDLLARTGVLRLQLFQRLQNKRLEERSWLVDALANHTETVASLWVAWVAQQASAVVMLALGLFCSLWLGLQGAPGFTPGFLLLAVVWLGLTLITLYRGMKLATLQAQCEREFRFDSEHFFSASSLWHILRTREGDEYRLHGAPSARSFWQAQQAQQLLAERAVWLLVGVSFIALLLVMATADESVLGQPLALIIPLLLLSAPEWLGRALTSLPSANRFQHSRNTLQQLDLVDCPPIDAPPLLRSLCLEQFAPRDYPAQPVTATLPASGIVEVSGSSGSGKSSLLKALVGHIPSTGERRVDDEALPEGLVSQWGYGEQTPVMLQGTLRANLIVGEARPEDQRMLQVLVQLGLESLTDLDVWLGTGGRQLSGGEQKRIALARMLLSDKVVWLLDEPFEALDGESLDKVVAALNAAAQDHLIVVATHLFPEQLEVVERIALD